MTAADAQRTPTPTPPHKEEGDSDVAPKLAFDPAALREKYRTERDRRLRDDGNEQYQEIKGRFAPTAARS